MNDFVKYLAIFSILILSACNSTTITMETLLEEMTNREVLTRFPEEAYTLKQFSSYDRKSTAPNEPGWFANDDYTRFIREEENNGRREFVMFDADGPGAVVRWWMTFAGEGAADGIIRIYIDNQTEPAIEANVLELLSGDLIASEPLAVSVSPETNYLQRGHNLYLPLPYNRHCKITYECDVIRNEDNRWLPSIYYNINYRTYTGNVEVESLSQSVIDKYRELIASAGEALSSSFPRPQEIVNEQTQTLAPGESMTFEINSGGKAISWLSAKLESENLPQALRSTVLSVAFDGQESVWVPVGDFFGTGYQIFPSETRFTSVSEDGLLQSCWLMPFRENAVVSFTNHGDTPVTVEAGAGVDDYAWDNNSMYFGTGWHEHYEVSTATDPDLENHEWHYDLNFVELTGKGVYAGDAVTVFNPVGDWWGEGDEKIYVDGEDFPSSIGTGSEDYYGYAWCLPAPFSHPFIAQPTGAGNLSPGMSVNMRYRMLDAIPFEQEIKSDIEMWHWAKTTVNYAMTSYWYALPGVQANRKAEPEAVKNPVALRRSDFYPPVIDANGRLEGENMEVTETPAGIAGSQSGPWGWSKGSQLWWRYGNSGDVLQARFIAEEPGIYRVTAQLTKAPDYGIIQLYINDKPAGGRFNGYNEDGVIPFEVNLGQHTLKKGDNTLSIRLLGSDDKAKPGNMAGIDYLQFIR